MEYPKNGSVLIVDDKYSEVESLLRVFHQNKVPTFYFNGNIDHFPSDGFENIRLVFLDINLDSDSESAGNEKVIISKLIAVLRRAINKDNGQYVLATWSSMSDTYFEALSTAIKEDEDREASKQVLKKHPVDIIKINKIDMQSEGEYDLVKIQTHIKNTISESSFLPYYISWENMVLESSKKVLNRFDIVSDEATNIRKIIALLANGTTMINEESVQNDVVQYGFTPLSTMLVDELQSNISNEIRLGLIDEGAKDSIFREAKTLMQTKDITPEQRAKINTLYHVGNSTTCAVGATCALNGNVYNYHDYLVKSCSTQSCNTKWAENLHYRIFDTTKKGTLKIKIGCFEEEYKLLSQAEQAAYASKQAYIDKRKEDQILSEILPIFLEISPDCDVAHDKRKKMRLIFGVMVPDSLDIEKKFDNFTDTLLIEYNHKMYKVIFDVQTVTAINFDVFAGITPIFRFKKEFVTDIQHKVGSHIARPGFFNMADF